MRRLPLSRLISFNPSEKPNEASCRKGTDLRWRVSDRWQHDGKRGERFKIVALHIRDPDDDLEPAVTVEQQTGRPAAQCGRDRVGYILHRQAVRAMASRSNLMSKVGNPCVCAIRRSATPRTFASTAAMRRSRRAHRIEVVAVHGDRDVALARHRSVR